MGLFAFIKEAGEKLFGTGEANAAADPAAANAKAAQAIHDYIVALKIAPPDLGVSFDAAKSLVAVSGTAPDQATREKILLAAGNVAGVAEVEIGPPIGSSYDLVDVNVKFAEFLDARELGAHLGR